MFEKKCIYQNPGLPITKMVNKQKQMELIALAIPNLNAVFPVLKGLEPAIPAAA